MQFSPCTGGCGASGWGGDVVCGGECGSVMVNSCIARRGLWATVKQWTWWTVKSADRDPLALWVSLLVLLLSIPILEHVVQQGFGRPLCCWPLCLVVGLVLDRGDGRGKDQCREMYTEHGRTAFAAERDTHLPQQRTSATCGRDGHASLMAETEQGRGHPAPGGGGGTTYPV